MSNIASGFEPLFFGSPFFDFIGPVYHCIYPTHEQLALLLEEKHCNTFMVAHGGLLSTLADVAMSRALVRARGDGTKALTISLSIDFIGTAVVGAWLEAHVALKKTSGTVGFATCEIREGDSVIVVANGAFRYVTPR
jgi:uncharacterized protein (TIGR00369 family)